MNSRAGETARYVGLVNGDEVPPGQIQSPIWTITGNVYPLKAVTYTPEVGEVTEFVNLDVYPLYALLVPATPGLAAMSVGIGLEGLYTGDPPGPFTAEDQINLSMPGVSQPAIVNYNGQVIKAFEANGEQWLTMLSYDPVTKNFNQGISLTLNFASLSNSGRIYAINLVNSLITVGKGQQRQVKQDTGGNFWYDGAQYPYTTPVPITGFGGPYQVVFKDAPSLELTPGMQQIGTVSYAFTALTFFFYDDPGNNIGPVLLTFPKVWGYSAELVFVNGEWAIQEPTILPATDVHSMLMPGWPANLTT